MEKVTFTLSYLGLMGLMGVWVFCLLTSILSSMGEIVLIAVFGSVFMKEVFNLTMHFAHTLVKRRSVQ